MKQFIAFIILGLLINTNAHAQDTFDILVNRDTVGHITKAELISDIDDYKNGIITNHVDPFTVISKVAFISRLDSLKAVAPKLNVDQLIVGLVQINALLQDPHTNIDFWMVDRLPYFTAFFGNDIYITTTEQSDTKYMYAKLIAINDVPTAKIIEKLATLMGATKKSVVMNFAGKIIFNPDILHGLGIAKTRESIKLTLATSDNKIVTIQPKVEDLRNKNLVNGFENVKLLSTLHKGPYWYKDTGDVLYFKYNACYDNPRFPIAQMIKNMTSYIDTKKPKKVVVDIRENGGGDPMLIEDFITYLSTSYLAHDSAVTVLIGSHTFSAAVLNAVELKNKTKALLVGEETGGDVVYMGETKQFVLPASKLKVSYSTKKFEYIKDYKGGLKPDVTIINKFADLVRGRDEALFYAMH